MTTKGMPAIWAPLSAALKIINIQSYSMKTRVLTFAFLLLGTLAFVSCQKDGADDGVSVGTDELAYLQGHFAYLDDNGILDLRAGWQLNEADPHELSMKADNYEAAAAIFKKIIPSGANISETETSLTWHLRDGEGKSQGDAVLRKETGDKVAVLSMPAAATLVSRVNFIPHSLWPENGEQEYREELDDFYFCNVVHIKVNLTQNAGTVFCRGQHGTGDFIILREYDQETNTWGIALRLTDRVRTAADVDKFIQNAPSLETFQEARNIYLEKKELLDKEMAKAGFSPSSSHFLVKDGSRKRVLGFDNGIEYLPFSYYECYVYYFGFTTRSENGNTQYSKYLYLK